MCKESEKKQSTTSTTAIPSWLEDASKTVVGKATTIADKPFEAYTGDRVADFTPDQQTAFQKLRDLISGGAPTEATQKYMTAPGQTIGTERVVDEGGRLGAVSDYINPFTQQALAPALQKIQESADAARKRIGAGATAAHAFGDARHGITEAQLDKTTSQTIGDTAATFLKQAYDTGMGHRSADLARFGDVDKFNAQGAETALTRALTGGNTMQTQLLQQIQALLGSGSIQQGGEQAKLDAIYQDFMREYQHDPQMLQLLSSVLGKTPYSKSTTGTGVETTPDNSGLGVAGSIVGSAAGSAPVSAAIASLLTAI